MLATVTVTYNPDLDMLVRQLRRLPADARKILVDNSGSTEVEAGLRKIAENFQPLELICNTRNVGLAAGLNQGIRRAVELHCDRVLLLDQDSEPEEGAVTCLEAGLDALKSAGVTIAAVGPRLVDAETGIEHGFHLIKRWIWSRIYPEPEAREPVAVDNLNGSGTLLDVAALAHVGELDEGLFIDHVDTEWSFRAKAKGFQLRGIPTACFRHRMGERTSQIWFLGWRAWPHRSSHRHYYLARNTARLLKRAYIPVVWKLGALAKLQLTMAVHLIGKQDDKAAHLKALCRGFVEGMRM